MPESKAPISKAFRAIVPSNIALIKYWGKKDERNQWPANDSLSMTLSAAHTVTEAIIHAGTEDSLVRNGLPVHGHSNGNGDPSQDKALKHLIKLRDLLGFEAKLCISTRNTFPSDCGIASSASGLGALTIAAIAAWTGAESFEHLESIGYSRQRLAMLARLGSGSACRSLLGGYVEWSAGSHPDEQKVRVVRDAEDFPLCDIIVILSQTAKPISSSAAHRHAWTSPLFAPRLAALKLRLDQVRTAILENDLPRLGEAIETEALEMHAVMMSSTPAAFYMTDETSKLLAWIRTERIAGRLDAWFTVDAGPNVHVICRPEAAEEVAHRISHDFGASHLLIDRVGRGPSLSRGGLL